MSPEEEPKKRRDVNCCEKRDSACTCRYMVNSTYFLWLSVRVIPWEETLKWTTVEVGGESESRVIVVAF